MKPGKLFTIAAALLLVVGCMMPDNTSGNTTSEIKWPLDGVKIKEVPTPDYERFEGTYQRTINYSLESELVSFKPDGTMYSIPFHYPVAHIVARFPRTEGGWTIDRDKNTISIVIGNDKIENKILSLTDDGKKIGFGYIDKNNNQVKYHKISEEYLDLDIFNSKTIEGIYARKNDYEEIYGWEFRKDGTAIEHTTDRKSFEYDYKTNPDKCILRMTDGLGFTDEYNYCLLDGYLYLDGKPFQKVK